VLTTTLPFLATDYSPKQEGGHCSEPASACASKKAGISNFSESATAARLFAAKKTTAQAVVFILQIFLLAGWHQFVYPGPGAAAKTLPSGAQTDQAPISQRHQ